MSLKKMNIHIQYEGVRLEISVLLLRWLMKCLNFMKEDWQFNEICLKACHIRSMAVMRNRFIVNWSIIFCLKNIYYLYISDFFRHFQIKPQLSSEREYTSNYDAS
jgi:hypothetical protein